MSRYYDWDKTMSYQTGTNGEICLVLGAKDISKTFGLRLRCINRFIKYGEKFCEICRTNEEMKAVMRGYFDKLQNEKFFLDYVFKTEQGCGYIAPIPPEGEKPEWQLLCYFVVPTDELYLAIERYKNALDEGNHSIMYMVISREQILNSELTKTEPKHDA